MLKRVTLPAALPAALPASLFLALLAPAPAFAHVGLGDAGGLGHGFAHPFTGPDHVLAMVTVGALAAGIGGRAPWLVPSCFMAAMAGGAGLGALGIGLPFAEIGVALSVVVLGLAVASGAALPVAVAAALAGVFAVAHGHVHGAEMPDTASGLLYGCGFLAATAALHGAGLAVGTLAVRAPAGRRATRIAGSAVAVAGCALLAGLA